jgi:Fic family protein
MDTNKIIKELLAKIDSARIQLDQSQNSTIDIIRLAPHFRLDWGGDSDQTNATDAYNSGATKSVIISGLTIESKRYKTTSSLFQNSEIAQTLIDTFINETLLTKQFLLKIHGLIVTGGGILRTEAVTVFDASKVVPNPFSNSPEIEKEIDELLSWYNIESKNENTHTITLSAIFHHGLLKIHPFYDGNGRLARILASMILLKKRLPPPRLLPIERIHYLSALRNADSGDIHPLVIFIGKKVLESLEYALIIKPTPNG